ncbi:hypothetical protein PVK06_004959 [Gossypium arboreum]|uniref:DUF4283 domain-containing protein n=1 Tax=Gossypium arboreum TaxID=29729 RepID=A0ABR0QUE7_GOSAR|nr:hypothetical protein PVK06_004959 [Gossypium arboreum]
MGKLGLSIYKLNKKIKTVNFKEVLTMGIVEGIELQIDGWKGKEDLGLIHLNGYDFVLGLKFLDWINALLVPFANCICILDTRQKKMCCVSESRRERWNQCIINNPTSQGYSVWKEHRLGRLEF